MKKQTRHKLKVGLMIALSIVLLVLAVVYGHFLGVAIKNGDITLGICLAIIEVGIALCEVICIILLK